MRRCVFSALMITLASPLKNGINDDVFNKNVRNAKLPTTFTRETREPAAVAAAPAPWKTRRPASAPRQHHLLLPPLGDRPEPPAAGARAPSPLRAHHRARDRGDRCRRRPCYPPECQRGPPRDALPVPRLYPARAGDAALG